MSPRTGEWHVTRGCRNASRTPLYTGGGRYQPQRTRLAGPQRAGALSGTVLGYGYLGLALAPSAFAGLGEATSTRTAFLALFALAGLAGAVLLFSRPGDQSGE